MQIFNLHPDTPQIRLIKQIARRLSQGEIGALPTDSTYALVSTLDNSKGKDRILKIRTLQKDHLFTLLCAGLKDSSSYANLTNENFRLIKRLIPGAYTFILPATREVPRRLIHRKRKTIGIRVPDNPVVINLLHIMQEPIMSVSLPIHEMGQFNDSRAIIEQLKSELDFFVDTQYYPQDQTTVLDCVENPPKIIRQGLGKLDGQ